MSFSGQQNAEAVDHKSLVPTKFIHHIDCQQGAVRAVRYNSKSVFVC